MITGKYNLHIQNSETFRQEFKFLGANGNPFDLSPFTASSYIKADYSAISASAIFTASIVSPTEGTLDLALSSADSATLTGSCYYYDIRLIHTDGTVLYPLEGKVLVSNSVTK